MPLVRWTLDGIPLLILLSCNENHSLSKRPGIRGTATWEQSFAWIQRDSWGQKHGSWESWHDLKNNYSKMIRWFVFWVLFINVPKGVLSSKRYCRHPGNTKQFAYGTFRWQATIVGKGRCLTFENYLKNQKTCDKQILLVQKHFVSWYQPERVRLKQNWSPQGTHAGAGVHPDSLNMSLLLGS